MSNKTTQSRGTARSSRGLRLRVTALLVIAMLAFPALAAGQSSSPTTEQYGDTANQAVEGAANTNDPGGTGGLGGDVGPLPFTGFDVIAMVAVALTVTGIGLALQRAVARESE